MIFSYKNVNRKTSKHLKPCEQQKLVCQGSKDISWFEDTQISESVFVQGNNSIYTVWSQYYKYLPIFDQDVTALLIYLTWSFHLSKVIDSAPCFFKIKPNFRVFKLLSQLEAVCSCKEKYLKTLQDRLIGYNYRCVIDTRRIHFFCSWI